MTAFRFPLDRVKCWRQKQRDIEREKLRTLLTELHRVEAGLREIAQAKAKALSKRASTGLELNALEAYTARLGAERKRLSEEQSGRLKRIEAQRDKLLAAERAVHLLERLAQRHRLEWDADLDRREEDLASEAFLNRPPS